MNVIDAELNVYKPNAESAHLTIPGVEISRSVEVTRRVQGWKDIGNIELENAIQYADEITRGDKIEFDVTIEQATYSSGSFGQSSFGQASFSGLGSAEIEKNWVGLVHPPSLASQGARVIEMSFESSDFVFQVLSDRRVYRTFDERQIATGDPQNPGIIERLINDLAPELSVDEVDTVNEVASYEFDGADLLEVITEIARDFDCIIASKGASLFFKQTADIPVLFELEPTDFGIIESDGTDTDLVNDLRVDGAEGSDVDESQETVDTYETVTNTNRIIHALDPRKSRLDKVDVWTRLTDTGSSVSVRIQQSNDAGDGPIAIDDETLDITNKQVDAEDMEDDDWTPFPLPREPLPPSPWLIIEAADEEGQDIGVDSNGNPAFKSHYPYPIAVRIEDSDSQDEYRWVMDRKKRDDLSSFDAARRYAEAIVRHNSSPAKTVSFDAASKRAHLLEPGDVVILDYPEIAADGEYLVTEVQEMYNASTVEVDTSVTVQHINTI